MSLKQVITEMNHPWQAGPAEMVNYALELMEKKGDIDSRISFLLFDVAVETTFKTYLLLPESITKTRIPFADRKKHATGTFHDLIKGIKRCTNLVSGSDLAHIEFYHDIRNRLYHQGDGITVAQKDLKGYSQLATKVLRKLLKVDLSGKTSLLPTKSSLSIDDKISLRTQLQKEVDDLKQIATLLIEEIEPKLILPSTTAKFAEISKRIEVANFPQKVSELRRLFEHVIANPETKKWLLYIITEDISWDSPQTLDNTKYLMEILADPHRFYILILGFLYFPIEDVTIDTIDRDEDFSFVDQEDYHILGIYSGGDFVVKWLSQPDSISEEWVYKRAQELVPKLQKLIREMNDKYLELHGKGG